MSPLESAKLKEAVFDRRIRDTHLRKRQSPIGLVVEVFRRFA
ncbi:hypothetical protein [Thermovibrio sp.]